MKYIILILLFLVAPVVQAYSLDEYDEELRPNNMEAVLGYLHYRDCARDVSDYDEFYMDSRHKTDEAITKLAPSEFYYVNLNEERHANRMLKQQEHWEREFKDCMKRGKKQGYEYVQPIDPERAELLLQIEQLKVLIGLLQQLI